VNREHWWNGNQQGKTEILREKLDPDHFVYHLSPPMDYGTLEHKSLRKEIGEAT
jgi:hypothetical protein